MKQSPAFTRLIVTLLFTQLAVAIGLQCPIFTRKLLHEDCEIFAHGAELLLKTGSLSDYGHLFSFQLLRDTGLDQGFYYGSISTILTLVPFFKVFGASDFSFYLAQSVWWLAILFTFRKKLRSWKEATTLFSLGVLLGCWDRSIYSAATNLPAIVIALGVWPFHLERPTVNRPAVFGLLTGLAFSFRPECIFLFFAVAAHLAFQKRFRAVVHTGLGFALVGIIHALFRRFLGAGPDTDYLFFNIGSSVFAPGLSTVGLPNSLPLSFIVTDPDYRWAMALKLWRFIVSMITFRSSLFSRADWFLLSIAVVGNCLGLLRWRRYWPLALLFLGNTILAATVLDFARYYDPFFTLLLFQLWVDLVPRVRATVIHPRLSLFLLAVLFSLHNTKAWKQREIDRYNREIILSMIEGVKATVPPNTLVISDQPHLWSWYGGGKYGSYIPLGNPDTLSRVLRRFPNAHLVLFLGGSRASELLDYAEKYMVKIESDPPIYKARRT